VRIITDDTSLCERFSMCTGSLGPKRGDAAVGGDLLLGLLLDAIQEVKEVWEVIKNCLSSSQY
jgi:hypothetical protein